MKHSHTPGPWRVDNGCPTDVLAPNDANIKFVVSQDTTVIDVNNATGMLEREANARLIAAAPDLLEALYGAMAYFDNADEGMRGDLFLLMVERCRAAIIKATGGSGGEDD